MADTWDLHQIEYRHHQTNDLSPVASSMSSRESLAAWHSRIRAWVRHPHADNLSESACYQAFSNGQAALAWRYRDERAASRADGTRGRPLVSRVLIGSASVLTFDVALAWGRTGPLAQWLGPLPGQVPEGSQLPVVSGEALAVAAREMTAELDQDSAGQAGLQAVVAARLGDLSTPLAISVPDPLIQLPLRQCVQCPLLWGLHRITGPLLASAGRGWSFSTFELALGETDPTSLPAIVFRAAQDGVKAPPSRWRKEAKVRPFERGALDGGASYAEMIEFAGWLVAEYRERGGDGLAQFVAECAGSAGPSALRMEQVWHALRKSRRPSEASEYRRQTSAPAQNFSEEYPPEGYSPEGGSAEAESQEPDPQEPAAEESRIREPDLPELDVREPEIQLPEIREPEIHEPDRREPAAREWAGREPAPPAHAGPGPVDALLRQLELLGEDQELFQSILDGIHRAGEMPLEEREKSWYVISGTGWYENIARNNSFRSGDLASIFAQVVIPELAGQLRAEEIAQWAMEAPVPMVEGMLAAAQADGAEAWDAAMGIVEPVLAYRWMVEHYLRDYWHGARAARPNADPGRADGKGGRFGLRRKPGGRHRG